MFAVLWSSELLTLPIVQLPFISVLFQSQQRTKPLTQTLKSFRVPEYYWFVENYAYALSLLTFPRHRVLKGTFVPMTYKGNALVISVYGHLVLVLGRRAKQRQNKVTDFMVTSKQIQTQEGSRNKTYAQWTCISGILPPNKPPSNFLSYF